MAHILSGHRRLHSDGSVLGMVLVAQHEVYSTKCEEDANYIYPTAFIMSKLTDI